MSETLKVLRPDYEEPKSAPVPLARRSAGPKRLLLVDNAKPKARDLLQYIAEELRSRIHLVSVDVHRKASAGRPLDPAEASALAAQADLVIAGLGDCGACSACSVHDALAFEARGVPATVLITDVFINNVARFSENLGHAGYHTLVVPHPVSSKPDEVLRRLAVSVADAARDQLVGRQDASASSAEPHEEPAATGLSAPAEAP